MPWLWFLRGFSEAVGKIYMKYLHVCESYIVALAIRAILPYDCEVTRSAVLAALCTHTHLMQESL